MTRPVGIEIFYWLDNWSDDQSSVFSKAAEAGYEGVEISLVAGLDVGVDRMARTASSLGLDVLCSTGLNPSMDISSPDAEVRAAGLQHLRRCLDDGTPVAPEPALPAPVQRRVARSVLALEEMERLRLIREGSEGDWNKALAEADRWLDGEAASG